MDASITLIEDQFEVEVLVCLTLHSAIRVRAHRNGCI